MCASKVPEEYLLNQNKTFLMVWKAYKIAFHFELKVLYCILANQLQFMNILILYTIIAQLINVMFHFN
jgi:hypothetical protein